MSTKIYLNNQSIQNSMKIKKIRTVQVNQRGQIVIPEEIRKDFAIGENTTLVMLEENNQIIIKKESEVLKVMDNEEKFWDVIRKESMKNAWTKEDEVWDKIYMGESKKWTRKK